MKKILFVLLAINFETIVIASDVSLTADSRSIQTNKRKKPQDQDLERFETARTKRRKNTNGGLQQYNISPLRQADVDQGDPNTLNPFIATLSETGQKTSLKLV